MNEMRPIRVSSVTPLKVKKKKVFICDKEHPRNLFNLETLDASKTPKAILS